MSELDKAALLRRFEPILQFTHGERFYPYNVDDYVRKSSLWVKKPKHPPEELISEADLTLEKLGSLHLEGSKHVYYLQFISPVNLAEMVEFRLNELREALKKREFQPTRSRLSRVGYLARMVDAAFSLMLLLRGRVPGDTMAAAVITFNKMLAQNAAYQYYGRVIRQSDWIILQYWYFYPFNNWRSGFYGANDHEADWEMINIYCFQDNQGDVKPSWVAYASHNYSGDDLRRHWDDPELEKYGEHPVVYVGGGSHASYYQRGEYLTELGLPFFQPLVKFNKRIAQLSDKDDDRRDDAEDGFGEQQQVLTIPFVDYALGDGLSIGCGCEASWEPPVVIEPAEDWVLNFRGLWGYFAQDPFAGEDAPAGPRYNRDGTVRQAWFDPLGWAGMEKVFPPIDQPEMLSARKAGIQAVINTLQTEIEVLQELHYERGFDLEAIRNLPYLQDEVDVLNRILEEERQELADKRRQLTVEQAKLESIERYGAAVMDGRPSVLRAHIKHAQQPQVKKSLRFSRLAEIWAAISIGLMMIAVVLLIVFARPFLFYGLAGLLLVMITIESAFRRRLADLVQWIAILLAIGGFIILILQFFWVIVLAGAMITGFYMIISNLRELFARQ